MLRSSEAAPWSRVRSCLALWVVVHETPGWSGREDDESGSGADGAARGGDACSALLPVAAGAEPNIVVAEDAEVRGHGLRRAAETGGTAAAAGALVKAGACRLVPIPEPATKPRGRWGHLRARLRAGSGWSRGREECVGGARAPGAASRRGCPGGASPRPLLSPPGAIPRRGAAGCGGRGCCSTSTSWRAPRSPVAGMSIQRRLGGRARGGDLGASGASGAPWRAALAGRRWRWMRETPSGVVPANREREGRCGSGR